MDRRSFVKRTAALASMSLVAGCSSSESPSDSQTTPPATTAQTTTGQQTTSPTTASDTTTSETPSRKRYGLFEVSAGQWMAKEYIRYFDPETESISRLTPTNDWWYEYTVDFRNLGNDPIENVDASQIGLFADGEVYDPLSELPEISWEQVRLREHSDYWQGPYAWSIPDTIEGGESEIAYLLFDAASSENPTIELTYDGETTHLSGRRVYSP